MQNVVTVKDRQIILHHAGGTYPIEFERCDNAEKLLSWILQLTGKVWVERAHIKGLIYEAEDQCGVKIDHDC